jgi:hypothetical protein
MQAKSLLSKHWQAPVATLLGVWLAASPWVLGPAGSTALRATCAALGIALAASAAAMAGTTRAGLGAWLTVVFALAAAALPWLSGFADQSAAAINFLGVGILAAALAFMVGLATSDPDNWWNDRVAH